MLKWAIPFNYRLAPNVGFGGLGGRAFGSPYQFWVFALNNPTGASLATVLKVVQRTRPVATQEHVFVSA
jgi:hypothetical protein